MLKKLGLIAAGGAVAGLIIGYRRTVTRPPLGCGVCKTLMPE